MQQLYADFTVYPNNGGWYFNGICEDFVRMSGFSPKQIKEMFSGNFLDFFCEHEALSLRECFSGLAHDQVAFPGSYKLKNAHGLDIHIVVHAELTPSKDSARVCILDVSNGFAKMQGVTTRLSSLEKSCPGGLCKVLMDDNFTIIWHNDNYLDMLGYTEEQFIHELNGRASGYVHPDDAHLVNKQFRELLDGNGRPTPIEVRIIRRDGGVRFLITTFGATGETHNGVPVFYSSGIDITESKRAQHLEWDAERFRIAMKQAKSCVWEYDIAQRKIYASESLSEIIGVEGDIENVPRSLLDSGIVHSDSAEEICALFRSVESAEPKAKCTAQVRTPDGEYIYVSISMTVLFNGDEPIKAVALMEDITEKHSLQLRYDEEENKRTAMTFDKVFACKLNMLENKVLEANTDIFPFLDNAQGRVTTLIQQNAREFVHPDDRTHYLQTLNDTSMLEKFERGVSDISLEYRVKSPEGRYFWQRASICTIREPRRGELWTYVYIKDIDDQKAAEFALRKHAEEDSLTRLFNRHATEEKCRAYLNNSKPDKVCAILSMDLDGFKNVNDSYGHTRGDELLSEVADILREQLEQCNTAIVGRVGGDEFLIFLPECCAIERSKQVAELLCDEIHDRFFAQYGVSTSIGIAFSPKDGQDYEGLYRCADAALYHAKRLGKNCCAVYEKSMEIDGGVEKLPVSREWLLDEASDFIYVSDLYSYELIYMNNNMRKMFGAGDDDSYKGKKCFKVLQNLDNPCDFCTNHLLTRESFYIWKHHNPILNQTFIVKDRIVDWYGRPARLEFANDISDILATTQSSMEISEVRDAILKCYRSLNGSKSHSDAMEDSFRAIGELYQADRVFLIMHDDKTNKYNFKYMWTREGAKLLDASPIEVEAAAAAFAVSEVGSYFKLDNRTAIFDISPDLYRSYERNGVICQRVVPFSLNGEPAGYIGIDNPLRLRDDMTALETLGYCAAEEFSKSALSDRLMGC